MFINIKNKFIRFARYKCINNKLQMKTNVEYFCNLHLYKDITQMYHNNRKFINHHYLVLH